MANKPNWTQGTDPVYSKATGAGSNADPYIPEGTTTLNASEVHAGEIGGHLVVSSGELTRTTTTAAYTASYAVTNSESASVPTEVPTITRVVNGTGYIVGAKLATNKKSITPRIRVHLFNAVNPTLAVDNAAWKEVYADIAKRISYFDLPAMTTGADATNSDMSRSMDMSLRIPFQTAAATRSVWYVLETLDAFTPASGQKFTLTLFADTN